MKENSNTRFPGPSDPIQRMLLNPEKFDPDKLKVNEVEQGSGVIFAKIPKIEGRISRRKKNDSGEYYIELIVSRGYDPESRQNRNKKVIIGTDISYYLKGMMIINDNYHEYFNKNGEILPPIRAQWTEEEIQKRKKEEQEAEQQKQSETINPSNQERITQAQYNDQSNVSYDEQSDIPKPDEDEEQEADEVTIRELREREAALDAREEELYRLQEELENIQMTVLLRTDEATKDHISILESVLLNHKNVVEAQAKRNPDKPMSLRQIQTINELLLEIQEHFRGSEIEDLLHLAEEPDGTKDRPGTTYGEMALLLNAYESSLYYFGIGRLRTKEPKANYEDKEDDEEYDEED